MNTLSETHQTEILKTFGERLKILRNGLDARHLSALMLPYRDNTDPSERWALWEKGKTMPDPAFEVLTKLAIFFHVSTDWLLGLTDDPTPPKEILPHATQPKD